MSMKKGQVNYNDFVLLGIVFMIMLFGIVLLWNAEERQTNKESSCTSSCEKIDAVFVEYESGYGNRKNSECWCMKNKEPIRIY